MIGVRTHEGVDYVEPLPMETLSLRDIEFDEVQEIEGGFVRKRDDSAGQMTLTRVNIDEKFGGRS